MLEIAIFTILLAAGALLLQARLAIPTPITIISAAFWLSSSPSCSPAL